MYGLRSLIAAKTDSNVNLAPKAITRNMVTWPDITVHEQSDRESNESDSTIVAPQPKVGETDTTHCESAMEEELHTLARRCSTRSLCGPSTLFPVPAGGPFDPNSEKLNVRKWAKAFYDDDFTGDIPLVTSGLAF